MGAVHSNGINKLKMNDRADGSTVNGGRKLTRIFDILEFPEVPKFDFSLLYEASSSSTLGGE